MATSCVVISAAVLLFCALLKTSSGANDNGDIRTTILGVTGAGKSSLANSITDSNKFPVGKGQMSKTKNCQSARITRNGRDMIIVDTPGIFDTEMDFKNLQERIIPFLDMTSPGPHIILYAIQAGRYTPQDIEGLHKYLEMFGEGILPFTILVFTHFTCSEKEYMSDLHPDLKVIVDKCNSRYIFMPPPTEKSETKSKTNDLLSMMDKLVTENNQRYYTNNMYKQQQKVVQEKQEAKRREEQEKKEEEQRRVEADEKARVEAKKKELQKAAEKAEQERLQIERDRQAAAAKAEAQRRETERLNQEIARQRQEQERLSRQHRRRRPLIRIGPISLF